MRAAGTERRHVDKRWAADTSSAGQSTSRCQAPCFVCWRASVEPAGRRSLWRLHYTHERQTITPIIISSFISLVELALPLSVSLRGRRDWPDWPDSVVMGLNEVRSATRTRMPIDALSLMRVASCSLHQLLANVPVHMLPVHNINRRLTPLMSFLADFVVRFIWAIFAD